MKRIISVLIVLCTLLTLSACNSAPVNTPDITSGDPSLTSTESITDEVTDRVLDGALLLYDGEAFVPVLIRPEKTDADTLALVLALKK